jgi:hypothetical protein
MSSSAPVFESGPRRSLWLALMAALALLVGCAPPWMVVKQSGPPSALQGVRSVSVSFDYTGLMVNGMGGAKSEAEWVAAKSADDANYPSTWASLKAKWEETYLVGILAQSPVVVTRAVDGSAAPADGAELKVTMNNFQVGKFIPFATTASQVQCSHAWARNGQVVDEIRTVSTVVPNIYAPSVFQHVQTIGRDAGKKSGKFLKSKQ